MIGAAEGRKFSDWDTFGPLPGLCEKTQETQWLLSYFIGTPTVRNNYYHECNYNYGKTPTK